MYQDGDYLQPIDQYNQTICRLQYVMIPPSGREHYSVHSWKAGPDCGKIYLFIFGDRIILTMSVAIELSSTTTQPSIIVCTAAYN